MSKNLVTIFLFTLIAGCKTMDYSISLKDAYQRLQNEKYNVFKSDSFGNIQYKIIKRDAAPILIIHGISGGFDQGVQSGLNLIPENHSILSISRFGYLESDLPNNPSPINQCKAYVEILDKLNIDKVFLLATSAGGTIAFRFALDFPERTKGMILVSSGYPRSEEIKGPVGPPGFIYSDRIFRFMLNNMQRTILKMFGVTRNEYLSAEDHEKRKLYDLFNTIMPIKPRKKGILNDQYLTNLDMNLNYNKYPIETIETPFLVLHAKNDPMAKYETMNKAIKRMNKVDVRVYETGGHVLFGHDVENIKLISNFLNRWAN